MLSMKNLHTAGDDHKIRHSWTKASPSHHFLLTLPFRHHASTTIPVIIILMMVNGEDLAHLEGGRVERGLGLVVAARGGEAAVQQELDHLNSEYL